MSKEDIEKLENEREEERKLLPVVKEEQMDVEEKAEGLEVKEKLEEPKLAVLRNNTLASVPPIRAEIEIEIKETIVHTKKKVKIP
jgi:hypothetical protein